MLLDRTKITQFHRDGFVAGGQVYSSEEADALSERMFAVAEGQGEGKAENVGGWSDGTTRVIQIVNIFKADSLFRQHLAQPLIVEAVASLMKTDTVRVWHDQVQYKPPHQGGATTWHQDHPYWPVIQPADLVSAWVALDDATIENGCMWMIPGSHLWGAYKNGSIESDETFTPTPDLSLVPGGHLPAKVPCEVKKGHVLFHHCLTWHGSPVNRSDRGRPAIAVHYMPGHTRYVPEGKPHLVEHNISVLPGEILRGEHFPTVLGNN
ncbi:MAG: phytanoyl-CoA dioxygenase family protein [Chthonomonadaceae bacterium]|nr:phytanoyl-CoA dioxygenase family protein [Chthonomonadaceae bacterium]